jgi:hypothetical protein
MLKLIPSPIIHLLPCPPNHNAKQKTYMIVSLSITYRMQPQPLQQPSLSLLQGHSHTFPAAACEKSARARNYAQNTLYQKDRQRDIPQMLSSLFAGWSGEIASMLFNMIANHLNVDDESTAILTEFLLVIRLRFLANSLQVMSYWSHLILTVNAILKCDLTLRSASSMLS